jgi:hypothetical protein
MNLGEIQTRVKRQFGDESGSLITDADILIWANDGQVDIIRKTDALASVQTTAVSVGTGSVTLPVDFLFAKGVTLNNVALSLVSFQEGFLATAGIPQDSKPGQCYVYNGKLWFNSQQATGNLVVFYNRRPAALVDATSIPEIPVQMHEDLVRYCISRAKELNEDLEGAGVIMSDYERRINMARAEIFTPDSNSYNGIRVLDGDMGNDYW